MSTASQPPPTKSPWSYYYFSIAVSALCVVAGWFIGGAPTAFIVAVLIVLETSLSLDNAVVNAKILENWDDKWRRIFLRWGILIAVFGMRLLFPIVIVCVSTGLGPIEVLRMAVYDQTEYARHMSEAHHQIAGFGGAFLLMVALGFFFGEKHVHWMEWAETRLTNFGQIEACAAAVTLTALLIAKSYVVPERQAEFFFAGAWGIVTFVVAHGLGTLVGGAEEDDAKASTSSSAPFIKAGIAGFFYIEILDASFSFDGVIGAFVLTTYLPVIMLGLGAGAFFVRSFTIHLVEAGTLSEYRYLEHGAFYAILVLAAIMLSPEVHLPEWIVGLSGAAILGAALLHSTLVNRREA